MAVERLHIHVHRVPAHAHVNGNLLFRIPGQHAMQRLGVYFHPNQFEPMFPSLAHTSAEVGIALERFETAARKTLV